MQTPELIKPWEQLSELVGRDDPEQINDFLNSINPADTALAVSRLTATEQSRLLTLLEPVMIAFLGIVVGGIVVAMYLPIFKMAAVI